MAEETSLETKLAELAKHVQDQARFTRAITVVCTAAVMGVLFWMIVQVFTLMPDMVIAKYMAALPQIVVQWHFTETASSKSTKTPAAAPAKAK